VRIVDQGARCASTTPFHTSYSYDCASGLREVLAAARAAGLTRLCVADHDTIEGALRLRALAGDDLEVVAGCEFTCDDGTYKAEVVEDAALSAACREVVEAFPLFGPAEPAPRARGTASSIAPIEVTSRRRYVPFRLSRVEGEEEGPKGPTKPSA
jgi:hypothetical protein